VNKTTLYDLHLELGANMVSFAGYPMPLHYREGVLREHLHTRAAASLFDLSPMGQIEVSGPQALEELEKLLPLDLEKISLSEMAYSFLPNEHGGVIDDLIITRRNRDNFLLVVNAVCKDKVIRYLSQQLTTSPLHILDDLSLLSLQGPRALAVLLQVFQPEVANLSFMQGMLVKFQRIECFVSRCGYSGEDGFEISITSKHAARLARHLLAIDGVKMAGLGARDSLRMEAGLCMYGRELDENICPVAAGLGSTIAGSRHHGGSKQGNFVGSDIILHHLATGTAQTRVGLIVQGKEPLREAAILCDEHGYEVGEITSSTFSPSLNHAIAMAYVDTRVSNGGVQLLTDVDGEEVFATVTHLPFIAHRYVSR
jgi:aminomethyltransferase